MYRFGGGGGWGDPLLRDPQAVLDDVWDEYVSVEGALRDYGVVITGSLEEMTLALDAEAPFSSEKGTTREQKPVPDRCRRRWHVHRLRLDAPDGTLQMQKSPTTPGDQSDGVLAGVTLLASGEGMSCRGYSAAPGPSCTVRPPATTR